MERFASDLEADSTAPNGAVFTRKFGGGKTLSGERECPDDAALERIDTAVARLPEG